MNVLRLFLPTWLALAACLPCSGMFVRQETETVPIDRLLLNLEKRAQKLLKERPLESSLIRPGETVQLYVLEDTSLNGRYEVQPDGSVTIPKTGRVRIAGRDLAGAGKPLETALLKHFKEVTVMLDQDAADRKGRLLPGETVTYIYAVARVHSMAYALKTDTFVVGKASGLPYFADRHGGYSSGLPPKEVKARTTEADKAEGRKHLEAAIRWYQKAVDHNPNYLPAQLGLAWCLDQHGEKAAALPGYRKAFALAWEKEGASKRLYSGPGMTEEIVEYMLKLLEPQKDEAEIARIKQYAATIRIKPRWITPILIPLTDQTELRSLVNPTADVAFDLDGSGLDRRWGWITPKAGWLVYDHDGSGRITSGLQLVGAVTFWIFWQNGYQALGALDDDGNSLLEGAELKGLAIWRDANSNGVSEPGEVQPLCHWSITALSCDHQTHSTGIPFSPAGVRFKDGTTHPSYDWMAPGQPTLVP